MKTNKSRRNKRQSRFRNTRNKRRISKRQRGGDNEDKKFNDITGDKRNIGKKVYFTYHGNEFEGEIMGNTTPSSLVIGYLSQNDIGDSNYKYIISYFGTSAGNVIRLQKPSTYWTPEKKKIATEIIGSITFETSQRGVSLPRHDDSEEN